MSGDVAERAPAQVLLVHRYFWPDTPPYAAMLHSIGRSLVANGHQVTVLTCQPSYRRGVVAQLPSRGVVEGMEVVRWRVLGDRRSHARKFLNLVWFCARLITSWRRFRRADVVMAATTPPILVALTCSLLARLAGARFVYHKQDMWPEVAGPRRGMRGLILEGLRKIDHGTERRAHRVVVLSEDMAESVRRRGGLDRQPIVLNNFDPWPALNNARSLGRGGKSGLDLVFAGNLGRFQGLEYVAQLITSLRRESHIRWHFFGDGEMQDDLGSLVNVDAPVQMHGYRPPAEVAEFLAEVADLGIVSLGVGVIRSAYPSKTMSYLRNGCPLLALVEQSSELARMVRGERLGLTAAQHDLGTLAEAIRELARDPSPLESARVQARATYERCFGMEGQLARWQTVLLDRETIT